jgi:hypothetical protein
MMGRRGELIAVAVIIISAFVLVWLPFAFG